MLADMTAEIEARNQLRRETGLPQLSVPTELRRLKAVQWRVEFETFYENERPKYNHLWNKSHLGWFGGHAIWARVRKQVAADFEAKKLRAQV
jgi:hypothetical protein